MNDVEFMRLAINEAQRGTSLGQSPFGACIVRQGQVVACSHNQVIATCDPTAHAEISAIRKACRLLQTPDLTGCDIYSTTEPCPMCFAAIHWARLSKIYFGSTIRDAMKAGFSELTISNAQMRDLGGAKIQIAGGLLADQCTPLFSLYQGPRY